MKYYIYNIYNIYNICYTNYQKAESSYRSVAKMRQHVAKMRQHVAKTKRRQHSNKKGALKGLRNNKTKVVKNRRIVQRGGGTYQDLVGIIRGGNPNNVANHIRHMMYPELRRLFITPPNRDEIDDQNRGNTALYTACRSPNPNVEMVNTLLYFGFKPDTGNYNKNGSFPQHGVVAAARDIMTTQSHVQIQYKIHNIEQLLLILEALKRAGADMSIQNRYNFTAFQEYSDRFSDGTITKNMIETFSPQIGERISNLLNPEYHPPPPPPPPIPECKLLKLPDSRHYTVQPSQNRFGFHYKDTNYYFCKEIYDKYVQKYHVVVGEDSHAKNVTVEVEHEGIKYTFNVQPLDPRDASSVGFDLPDPDTCKVKARFLRV